MSVPIYDLFNIKKGTLIKGLKSNYKGQLTFSFEGWAFEERRVIKNIWSPVDRNRFTILSFKDSFIRSFLTEEKIKICNEKSLSFRVLRENGNAFNSSPEPNFFQHLVNEGDCIGMSLGESFCTITPSTYDMYRPDFYQVFLFHKILYEDQILWVGLLSQQIGKEKVLFNDDLSSLKIMMSLV